LKLNECGVAKMEIQPVGPKTIQTWTPQVIVRLKSKKFWEF